MSDCCLQIGNATKPALGAATRKLAHIRFGALRTKTLVAIAGGTVLSPAKKRKKLLTHNTVYCQPPEIGHAQTRIHRCALAQPDAFRSPFLPCP
jgi:hypothetical protein